MISKLISKLAKASKSGHVPLLLIGVGFALGAATCLSFNLVRVVPIGVAFGILCFGCGIVWMQFLELRRQAKAGMDSFCYWMKATFELSEEEAKLEEDKSAWEEEKEKWEEETEKMFKKAALRLTDKEGTQRRPN
jgi:hypothetical protein